MKTFLRGLALAACLGMLSLPLRAQAPAFDRAQLEALLAPVALQQDAVLWQVLAAATAPEEVIEAARWSRANRGFTGSDAVRAVEDRPWQPAVKALVAYPELLERMAESPQWLADLGDAYLAQEQEVLAAVQALRRRAHAEGTLQSDPHQVVQLQGEVIAVMPSVQFVYTVRYYDPYVVYGRWWLPHRAVAWRPWTPRPVFVTNVVVHRPARRAHRVDGPPSPAARIQQKHSREYRERHGVQRYERVPESQRRPIVRSTERPRGLALDSRPLSLGRDGPAHGAHPSRNRAADSRGAGRVGALRGDRPRGADRGLSGGRSRAAAAHRPRHRD